jgi:hypothetical protein
MRFEAFDQFGAGHPSHNVVTFPGFARCDGLRCLLFPGAENEPIPDLNNRKMFLYYFQSCGISSYIDWQIGQLWVHRKRLRKRGREFERYGDVEFFRCVWSPPHRGDCNYELNENLVQNPDVPDLVPAEGVVVHFKGPGLCVPGMYHRNHYLRSSPFFLITFTLNHCFLEGAPV